MIENVSTQLTVFHCLCPLPASRKGLRLPLRSALFGEGGRDWRPCITGLAGTSENIKYSSLSLTLELIRLVCRKLHIVLVYTMLTTLHLSRSEISFQYIEELLQHIEL